MTRDSIDDTVTTEGVVYLDHNATTPVLPGVAEAVSAAMREAWGNPSSSHAHGRCARRAIEEARARVASLLDCEPDEIVFTSGGTEASNLAIRGVAESSTPARRHVVTSVIEHPATLAPCAWLEAHGWSVSRLGCDGSGRVAFHEAETPIDESTALVSVMHANNETGVVQPVRSIADRAHAHGAVVHVDAAQSVGKIPVRARDLDADLLSVAGHKLYAPKGIGALFVRRGTAIRPFLLGAGHERGLRPGTENVPGIVGLGWACEIARRDLELEGVRVAALRDRLADRLRRDVPGLLIHGESTERLPNTLSVRFPRATGSAILAAAPDVAASTGSACHAHGEAASAVIVAMGVAPAEALGTVRLSLGRGTTIEQVDRAESSLVRAWAGVASGAG